MNFRTLCLSLILPIAFMSQGAHAQDAEPAAKEEAPKEKKAAPAPVQLDPSLTAVQILADILVNMNQQPTKDQKRVLEAVTNSTAYTENARNMAGVMKNINGAVQQGDKSRLWSVFRAISAGEDERELAKIINKFDGKVNPGQANRLSKLLPPKPEPEEGAEEGKGKEKAKGDKKADKKKEKEAKN